MPLPDTPRSLLAHRQEHRNQAAMPGIDRPNESSAVHPRAPLYERPIGKASPDQLNMSAVQNRGREEKGQDMLRSRIPPLERRAEMLCNRQCRNGPSPVEYPGKRRLRSGTVQLTAEESVVPIIVRLVQEVF